jgi:HSP20 family molecular chaperone IbpA
MSFFSTFINPASSVRAESDQHPPIRPRFEVEETDAAYGLTVFLPGVSKEGLEITDEDSELCIRGKRATAMPSGAVALHRESSDAPYELALTHDNTVDTGKIVAEIRDGVLRLSLPKTESAKPRKIAIS